MTSAIDLFCGAGGLSRGLQDAGLDVRLAVDHDADSLATYRANFPAVTTELTDLSVLTPERLLELAGLKPGECVLLAGGPPCQGFSVQRRGPAQDPRNALVLDFCRLVEGVAPQYFLMENVGGLISKRGRPFFDEIRRRFVGAGYRCHVTRLDAVDFGVPQFRSRVFFVGERTELCGRFRFPDATTASEDSRLTVRDAIGSLPEPPPDGTVHPDFRNHYREARMSPLNLERIRHVPEGGGREHLPEHLQLPCHRNNPTHRHLDVYGRLAWDRPSGTLTAVFDSFTRGRFGHPEQHRSITLREGARLQTFPDGFGFIGSRESCARQIGNAVPPLLAKQLGAAVLRAIRSDPTSAAAPTEQLALSI